jgi:rare lipoprotein A
MIRLVAAFALLCSALPAAAQDFLAGVRAIEVTMRRERSLEVPQGTVCTASQYGVGDRYNGRRTASGERFNTYALTAAHRTRRFGSRVTVTNLANGRNVGVRINDRGPFVRGRCIDLSHAAARAIGMGGLARVRVQ